MKTRNGFVSNSSSSSFIIGVSGELTEEKIMRAFNIGQNSPLYGIAKSIAGVLMGADSYTKEAYFEDHCYEDDSELTETEKKIFNKGFTLYSGSASDDGYGADGAESALCNIDLDYEDEDIIIFKEAGY